MRINDNYVHPVVDFSYWNTAADVDGTHQLDVPRLQAAGVVGAIVRAGKGTRNLSASHGEDRHFNASAVAMNAHEFPWMPYWRIFNLWYESPASQAHTFMRVLAGRYLDNSAPIWIDCEEWDDTDGHILGPTFVTDWVLEFMDTLILEGYRNIGIYTRANWWDSVMPVTAVEYGAMNAYPLWVAHWPSSTVRSEFGNYRSRARTWDEYIVDVMPDGPNIPKAWKDWDMWQFMGEGSGAGKVLGFASEDLDVNLVKSSTWKRWFGTS